ncbi:MAG: 50S ribosomal protein L6 [Candidatus Eremiobacteraeota bacterium]|nr:50S ribosomal protein L6 [Candidatus Eremiobacteraeota bacterium]MBC5826656.1 50S ribosomal protein L6 [Candidatus Eremiobacteraeota bacterium]
MSRIGRMPIAVPSGVDVGLHDHTVSVKGPKGELTLRFAEAMAVKIADGSVTVSRPNEDKRSKQLHGLTRTLISNMVDGVTKGFVKTLEIQGVGYRAQMQGKQLTLQLGFSHPVVIAPPEDVSITVEGTNKITVMGADKQRVGQMAAQIRSIRPPEPYKGKGIRYTGERVRRKLGKAGKTGGKK